MELKDLLDALDIEVGEDATPDDIQAAVKGKWVPRDLAHQDSEIVGRIVGANETVMKKNLREVAETLGLKDEDLQGFRLSNLSDKDPEKNILLKAKARVEGRYAELAEKAKGKDNSKAAEEWQAKLEKAAMEANSYKEMLANKDKEFSDFREGIEQERKAFRINHAQEQALKSLKLSDEVDKIRMLGFNTYMKESYKFDLDEAGNIKVLDKDGQQVKNAKGTGFASLEEVLERELDANKMLKKNNVEGKPGKPYSFKPTGDKALKPEKDTPNFKRAQEHLDRIRANASR